LILGRKPRPQLFSGCFGTPSVTVLVVAASCLQARMSLIEPALSLRYATEPLALTHDVWLVL
jgi:hypothetical protein